MRLRQGAEDFNAEEDSFEIVTSPESFEVRQKLEETGIPMARQVTMVPQELYRSYRP